MKSILTLIKKELTRVFKDRRLVISIFILPGLMLFLMYSLMGNALRNYTNSPAKHQSTIYIYNSPNEYLTLLEQEIIDDGKIVLIAPKITQLNNLDDLTNLKDKVITNEIDLIIIFEESTSQKDLVYYYYNPGNQNSVYIKEIAESYLTYYNPYSIINNQLFDENTMVSDAFTGLMPFLIITFIFSGIIAIAPESISGEKERGTIATLLITPIKRSHIALGKVASLSILALISAASSFIGIILSLNNLVDDPAYIQKLYQISDYLLILVVITATVLLIVSIASIISAYAKNVKEASMYVTPIMFLSMVVSISSMFVKSAATNSFLYLIPIYNTVQSLIQIFSLQIIPFNLIITIISNLIYTILFIFILAKMFNNEKVMFKK